MRSIRFLLTRSSLFSGRNNSAIKAPTLVIHGSEDPFNPIEAGKEIAATIPGAELLILDGMGHSFPNELIPKIIDAIAANSKKG